MRTMVPWARPTLLVAGALRWCDQAGQTDTRHRDLLPARHCHLLFIDLVILKAASANFLLLSYPSEQSVVAFGQVVPMVLILLVVFTLWEEYEKL